MIYIKTEKSRHLQTAIEKIAFFSVQDTRQVKYSVNIELVSSFFLCVCASICICAINVYIDAIDRSDVVSDVRVTFRSRFTCITSCVYKLNLKLHQSERYKCQNEL